MQNTWDKSAPWRWEKKCIYNIQLEKKIKKWMDKIDSQALLPTTFKAEMAAK